jgi:hypothetical protein
MKINFNTWGPATVLVVVIAVIAVAIGGVVTIVNPDALSFQSYLEDLQRFAAAVAGLGLARAVHLGAASVATKSAVGDNTTVAAGSDSVGSELVDSGSIEPDQGDAGEAGAK